MSKNYVDLKVSDLREECKKKNLEATGLKVHLVERLTKYDKDIQNIENQKVAEKKSPEPTNTDEINDDVQVVTTEIKKQSPIKDVPKIKLPSLFERASTEPHDWETRTDVHLDFYNSDLNLVIEPTGFSAQPISENGFEYMFAGVKANYGVNCGKLYFEVKIVNKINVKLESDVGESNVIRVGWSTNNSSLALGQEELSFAFDNAGKKLSNNLYSDYGASFKEGDIIGCFVEFKVETFVINFSINGEDQGEAFNVEIESLGEQLLLPHIYVRNIVFDVNFGSNDEASFPPKIDDPSWIMFDKMESTDLLRTCYPPKSKAECEVLMMCGLPSCGKTTWVDNTTKSNQEKFYNVLSTNVVLEKMNVMSLRKKCAGSRWDSFIQSATQCLNKLMEIAVTRRRNFILDQTNVYPTAQRRRMKTFEEFIRKAIIIVPTDDEYQRRMNQVITEEGKDVPESAVLQMKENFVIPEENSDLFNEIVFIELQRPEAEELVKKYNEESKNKKKADEHNNKRPERDNSSPYGKWNDSPKESDTEASPPHVAKKSRWNEDHSEEKSSKSKDYDRKTSTSSHSSKKNEYKGGFCFAREADDTDKGASRNSYRSDDKYESKDKDRSRSRDQKSDKYGSRSGGGSDSRRDRDRTDDRRGRSRERVSDQRGGYAQNKDNRSTRGSYNDRRPTNSYDSGESRGRLSKNDYGGSGGSRFGAAPSSGFDAQEPRMSRFQAGQTMDRGDTRGHGGSGASDMRSGNTGRGGGGVGYGSVGANGPARGGYQQKYSEFNPYDTSSREAVAPRYQQEQDYDYKSATGYDSQQSQDARPRTGFGVPKEAPGAASKPAGGRVVGGRWGGAPASFDSGAPPPLAVPTNYRPSTTSSYDNEQYGTEMDTGDYYAGMYSGPDQRGMSGGTQPRGAGSVSGAAPSARGQYPGKPSEVESGRFGNPYDSGNATFYAIKPPASATDGTAKYNNPYDNKSPAVTHPGSYDSTAGKFSGASRYPGKAAELAPMFNNPYDSQMSESPKLSNPYDIKTGGPASRFGNKGPEDSQRYSNPYDSKTGPNSSKFNNPYDTKSAPGPYKADEQAKFANPYDTKAAPSSVTATSTYRQESYYNKSDDGVNPYNSKSGPSTGSYGAPSQSMHGTSGDNYEDYQSYESTGGNEDKDYYGYYSEDASQSSYGTGASTGYNKPPPQSLPSGQSSAPFKAPPTGSFKAPIAGTARGAYNAPIKTPYNAPNSGSYSGQSPGAYNTSSTGTFNTQQTGSYNTPASGAYKTQSTGSYNTPSSGSYNAQSTGSYNTPSSGSYNAQSTGSYNTPSTGAYNPPVSGAYKTQSTGAYNTPASGGYNASGPGAYQSSGSYNAQLSGGYNAPASAAYNAQSTGAYKAPLAGAYKAPSNSAYNSAASSSASGVYNAQSTGAYKAATGGEYSNAQYGSYTNTATGAYGNQSSGTYGGNNPKSSSSDAKGNPVTAGSYNNPYSNCYESSSGNSAAQSSGYDYYGEGPTGAAKTGDSKPSLAGAPGGNATSGSNAAGAYDDYSQYYGQY